MSRKAFVSMTILALAAAIPVAEAGSGKSQGRYATHNTMAETTELPDGGSVVVGHFKQFTFADDARHPIDNGAQDCTGVTRLDADGNTVSASGSCFGTDEDGDRMSWWWRQEETGTTACPNACGVWGFFAGDGKYEGIKGSGTWKVTARFEDGGVGVWKGEYSIP